MTTKEILTDAIQSLEETELQEVADYLAFLKFRARAHSIPRSNYSDLASLYGEFGEEDRRLAEEGMADFERSLQLEDTQ